MKSSLFLVAMLLGYFCNAQNYECLQGGLTHFFTNGNGYLRGIRIDSIKTAGDSTIYYPKRSLRYPPRDPLGGCWLGKKVVLTPDGKFVFDSYWNDSVVLRTHAAIGETWVFYKDSTGINYKATMTSRDTMSVLSTTDSVETITINAFRDSVALPSDVLDGFKIIISKNHGFVQVFDQYLFPYHKPGDAIGSDYDEWLALSSDNFDQASSLNWLDVLNFSNIVFKISDFAPPNDIQLNNWAIGDKFEIVLDEFSGAISGCRNDVFTYIIDSVISRNVNPHAVIVGVARKQMKVDLRVCYASVIKADTTISTYDTSYLFRDYDYSIVGDSYVPEPSSETDILFYFPQDTGFCFVGPNFSYTAYPGWSGNLDYSIYRLGQGITKHEKYYSFGQYYNGSSFNLKFMSYHGLECGSAFDIKIDIQIPIPPVLVPRTEFQLYPNPVHDSICISSTDTIQNVEIYNLLGQNVFKGSYNATEVHIRVFDFTSGLYFVKANSRFIGKLVKH